MKENVDFYISDLNEMVKRKQKELADCEQELNNFDHSYIVRNALSYYKLLLQADLKIYNHKLINALKESQGVS